MPSYTFYGLSYASAAIVAISLSLSGCAVGPDYVRPAIETPSHYREAGPWKLAQPQAIDSHHVWWEVYGDHTLNQLVQQANQANQNIRQAEAQYRQARAAADAVRSNLWPTVGINANATRALTNSNGVKLGNDFSTGIQTSWEPDIWGSVRRSVEAGDVSSQASAAQLAAARLSIQATLVQDYWQLRVIDTLKDLYERTTDAYTHALHLTQSQYAAGVALRSDVALAQSQLQTAKAQAIDLEAQRSQLEHAIAILMGKAPADFSLASTRHPERLTPLQVHLPAVPVGLPSDLLERRPDIANAERAVALANANIGVAQAAYFPSLILSASDGFNASRLSTLLDSPSRVWSLGASLAAVVFDGGLRRAHNEQALAAYDGAVAQYRQTVLTGFQEVEDNLTALSVLEREAVAQRQAVAAAQMAEELALQQYRAGTATFLTVVTAQTLALNNERTLMQLLGRQLAAHVALIKATGGGWSNSQLPTVAQDTSPMSSLDASAAPSND